VVQLSSAFLGNGAAAFISALYYVVDDRSQSVLTSRGADAVCVMSTQLNDVWLDIRRRMHRL
jgi:hypothetical protein